MKIAAELPPLVETVNVYLTENLDLVGTMPKKGSVLPMLAVPGPRPVGKSLPLVGKNPDLMVKNAG